MTTTNKKVDAGGNVIHSSIVNYVEQVKITEDGGVIKKVLKAAAEEDAPYPHDNETVTIVLRARLEQCNMIEPDGIIFS
jgi:hypothetical protein